MRSARAISTFVLAAVAVTGCTARAAVRPAAAPPSPSSAPSAAPSPAKPVASTPASPTPTSAPASHPAIGRCSASALRGSDLGTEGAAGTIWVTIKLRNVSTATCTVRAVPGVRLLGAQGQPVTPPSVSGGAAGDRLAVVAVRPGAAARFAVGAIDVCDAIVTGSRIRVTPAPGMEGLVVPLAEQLATCRSLQVQRLEPTAW
jgi:hypothetical protein